LEAERLETGTRGELMRDSWARRLLERLTKLKLGRAHHTRSPLPLLPSGPGGVRGALLVGPHGTGIGPCSWTTGTPGGHLRQALPLRAARAILLSELAAG